MSVKVLENDTLNSSSFDSLFKEIIINEKLSDAMRKKKIDMSVKVTVYRLDSKTLATSDEFELKFKLLVMSLS